MSVTIEFDGRYQKRFKDVEPNEVVLEGRNLSIRDTRIPVPDDRLYDLFYFLEKITRYKIGKISIALLSEGEMKYTGRATDNVPDYYAEKILGFGVARDYYIIHRSIKSIPSEEEYKMGGMEDW